MSATRVEALAAAQSLEEILKQLCEGGDQSGDSLECARDYVADVIALLEERANFPTREPSPDLDGKRGGAVQVLICERALAQIHRTKKFIESHFEETDDEPPGWCPIEACYHLSEAINMLEPVDDEVSSS